MFRRIRGRRSFFFSSLRYTTFALSRRVNKSRIVRGIWSAFDAGRARLVAARGRREEGERRLGREIRRKPRNDSPARREISFSSLHETYIRLAPRLVCILSPFISPDTQETSILYVFS